MPETFEGTFGTDPSLLEGMAYLRCGRRRAARSIAAAALHTWLLRFVSPAPSGLLLAIWPEARQRTSPTQMRFDPGWCLSEGSQPGDLFLIAFDDGSVLVGQNKPEASVSRRIQMHGPRLTSKPVGLLPWVFALNPKPTDGRAQISVEVDQSSHLRARLRASSDKDETWSLSEEGREPLTPEQSRPVEDLLLDLRRLRPAFESAPPLQPLTGTPLLPPRMASPSFLPHRAWSRDEGLVLQRWCGGIATWAYRELKTVSSCIEDVHVRIHSWHRELRTREPAVSVSTVWGVQAPEDLLTKRRPAINAALEQALADRSRFPFPVPPERMAGLNFRSEGGKRHRVEEVLVADCRVLSDLSAHALMDLRRRYGSLDQA